MMFLRNTIRRAAPALALGLVMVACDDGAGPSADGVEIVFQQGVDVQLTGDDLALGDDVDTDRALTIYHSLLYEYGGHGDFTTSAVWTDAWGSQFRYELDPVEQEGTTIMAYLDFGDVSMDGEAFRKITNIPTSRSGEIAYENFVDYVGIHRLESLDINGQQATVAEAGYAADLLAGRRVTFTATGSDQVAGFEADVSIDPAPAVADLLNDGPVGFAQARPFIDAEHDLVIAFDGAVDPASTRFVVVPWIGELPEASRRDASFVGTLPSATDRAVISSGTLQELLDAAGTDDAGFYVMILRTDERDQTIDITRLDTDETVSMPVVYVDFLEWDIRVRR